MGGILANIFEFVGNIVSQASNVGCFAFFYDEPEMPKHLIEK